MAATCHVYAYMSILPTKSLQIAKNNLDDYT